MNEKKSSKEIDDTPLNYIKINQKNIIEELTEEDYISITSNLLKTFTIIEDNIGSEINKFFNILIPESKESDQLKLNIAISSKSKVENTILENYLNDIMNRPELNYVVLNKEMNEQISTIIKEAYKKLKLKKIKKYEQIAEEGKKFIEKNNYKDILKKYRKEKIKGLKTLGENDMLLYNKNNSLNKTQIDPPLKESKSNKIISKIKNQSFKGKLPNIEKNENYFYVFKKSNEDNNYNLPLEMLILIRKFNFVKKLKLVLKTENNNNDEENNTNTNIFNFLSNNFINNSGYSNDSYLDKTDVQNTILVFLNLEWLFPNVVEIDVDLTCPELTDYLVNNIYSTYLKIFSKIFKKDIKLNILPNNSKNNNRNYDPVQKFLYTNVSTTYSHIYDEEHSSDKFSTSMLSNNLNISTSIGQINNNNNNSINQSMNNININTSFQSLETLNQKKMDLFFKKYSSFLEMIIIYGYFIQKKLSKAIKSKFILPQNLCDEIVKLLKKQKVIIENYHFFSFINNQNILHTTIDFNALDNQTFEKVLNFLNKNQLINNCNISFFPPEECFKSELLLKTLQNTDENYKIKINKYGIFDFNSNFLIKDIYPSEDINTYILRKLSKYFEKNLTDFFNILTIKTGIADLSLYFDLPQILINNGLYNNILIKFFMNLFIFINNSLNNIKTLLISADNVIIDERQHPILDQFFNELNFNDSNQEFKLLNLCFNAKMYYIKNIYKLLSKDLIYLSIGAFDYVTFNSFVDFFCSKNFRQKSNLINLKISLNNSAFDVNYVYDNIIKLFTQFPNQMVEINLTTSLIISYEQIEKIFSKINYNKLIKVLMEFNIRSINKDKKLEDLFDGDLIDIDKDTCITIDDFMDSRTLRKDNNISNNIINLMINLKKINPDFLNHNIYSNIERFLCHNDKKSVIIQFKS